MNFTDKKTFSELSAYTKNYLKTFNIIKYNHNFFYTYYKNIFNLCLFYVGLITVFNGSTMTPL